jgi:hypothetical protein
MKYRWGLFVWVAIILFCHTLFAQGQKQRQPSLAELKKMPGRIVAENHHAAPETPMKLKGYRVEKLSFPAMSARVEGATVQVTEGWRITAFFDQPLTVRNAAFSLVLDGKWCGFLAESPDLLSADAICFNSSLVRDGAAVGVTYRNVHIKSPQEPSGLTGPVADAVLEDQGEAIHYSSAKIRLKP